MKILYYTGWTITRVITRVLFRIKITGTEHIPSKGGFILASNHISYYDPPIVGSWSPRQMCFFAKSELFRNWLFGGMIRRMNAIPVKRGAMDRRAIEIALEAIADGYGLVVFPEGHRSKTGEFLDPKAGVGMLAVRSGCPIIPAYVNGADRLKACLLGKTRMSVTYGEPLSADWVKSRGSDKGSYEEISRVVMERIAALKAGKGK